MTKKAIKNIESLKLAIIGDCKKYENCFNENGCNVNPSKCFHKYCDKYKWIIDRAKHYEKRIGISYLKIIQAWEKKRTYWYQNYYQECNQPLLNENVKIYDTVEDVKKAIGNKFRCPNCKGITTNPYECNSKKITKDIKDGKKRACNWKVYGLFGSLGKGVSIFIKDKLANEHIFMPIIWEAGRKKNDGIKEASSQ